MTTLTRQQREALHRVWKRSDGHHLRMTGELRSASGMSYREFRRGVVPYSDGSGCVMVPWCGMWLGIETDGYTHS